MLFEYSNRTVWRKSSLLREYALAGRRLLFFFLACNHSLNSVEISRKKEHPQHSVALTDDGAALLGKSVHGSSPQPSLGAPG